ncbi:MAG: CBS domain-containing protein [Candidatus Micrarchaeota archaeon]|nr:CBS domain-containing protein [Candidatus Micrarchaeota archaeon]
MATEMNPFRRLIKILKGEKPSIPLEAIMQKGVVVLESSKSALDAAKVMEKNKIGSVIVTEKGKAVGIVTERDLVRRVLAARKSPSIKLKSILSSPLRVARPDQDIQEAVLAMKKYKIKKLAIVDNRGRLVGIVTDTDITRALPGMMDILQEIRNYRRISEEATTVGICQKCGLYSETLQYVNGELICEECREQEAEEYEQ